MKHEKGFSLFEMLIVIGIIALLVLSTIPALSLIHSVSLSNEVDRVAGELKKARQQAISENRTLEIRLYSYRGNRSDETKIIRSIQTWERTDAGNFTPVTPLQKLAAPVVISEDLAITQIGPSLNPSEPTEEAQLPSGATYRAFRFRPAGTTNLDLSEEWFFTMHLEGQTGTPPPNFATFVIEPLTGAAQVLRP